MKNESKTFAMSSDFWSLLVATTGAQGFIPTNGYSWQMPLWAAALLTAAGSAGWLYLLLSRFRAKA